MDGLLFLLWIIDVFNLGTDIYGFDLAYFLDTLLPINTFEWFLIFIFAGSSTAVSNSNN